MSSNELVNSLRSQSEAARTRLEQEAAQSEEQQRQSSADAETRKAERIATFVTESLEPEFQRLYGKADKAALKGETAAEIEWRIPYIDAKRELITSDNEELVKHKALSVSLAERFTQIGFTSSLIDTRYLHREYIAGEGPTTTETDYLIGVKISWADQQPATE